MSAADRSPKTTPAMRTEIVTLYLCGMEQADLAREFDLHPSSVRSILVARGVALRPKQAKGRARAEKCQRGHDMEEWGRERTEKGRAPTRFCLKCRRKSDARWHREKYRTQ